MVTRYMKTVFNRFTEYIIYYNFRQNKINKLDFRRSVVENKHYTPVFFLSTGRAGTAFFTKLLNKSSKVKVFHSPSSLFCNAQSELIEQGRVAYETYKQVGFNDDLSNILLSQVFIAVREDLLYKTYLHKKLYIETNNRITFLAPAIKYLIPNAKFVHLYRHPGEFIRSGIRREYYKSNSEHELGRLVPQRGDKYFDSWESFDDIQRIAWLWKGTNSFIEEYLQGIDSKDYLQFNFNNLTIDNISKLLKFINIDDISEATVEDSIVKPVNAQKRGTFPSYNKWGKEDKEKVVEICGELSQKYGFEL